MGKRSIPKEERVAPTIRKGCAIGVGYQQHLYWGEHPCKACQAGNYAKAQAWKLANPEKAKDTYKQWRIDNWESLKEEKRKWAKENLKRVREIKQKSSRAHPETSQRRNRARRARLYNAVREPYNDQDAIDLYGSDCHICAEPIDLLAPRGCGQEGWEKGLHLDHLTPLKRGGTDTLDNIRPAHGLCNVKKGIQEYDLSTTLVKETSNDR